MGDIFDQEAMRAADADFQAAPASDVRSEAELRLEIAKKIDPDAWLWPFADAKSRDTAMRKADDLIAARKSAPASGQGGDLREAIGGPVTADENEISTAIKDRWDALVGPATGHGAICEVPGGFARASLCDEFARAVTALATPAAHPATVGAAGLDQIATFIRGAMYTEAAIQRLPFLEQEKPRTQAVEVYTNCVLSAIPADQPQAASEGVRGLIEVLDHFRQFVRVQRIAWAGNPQVADGERTIARAERELAAITPDERGAGAGGWQLIETAPKDGKPILGFDAERGVCFLIWSDEHSGWFDEYGIREDPWEGNKYNPTHWMPLPAAPAAPEEPLP